ncbi:MAG: heavy metal translocating P-type ATPase [Euryarchaeota archaeon]|nr:heavy metal translocating P-type ATPase [Euryarchaeota archaeon]
MATDPVCGMFVDERSAELKLVRENRTYYFCNTSCLQTFSAPEKVLHDLRRKLSVGWPLAAATLILTYFWNIPKWPFAAFLLASVVQVYVAQSFYRGTWDAIKSHIANMDVLIAVGTTVAYLYSVAALFLPSRLPQVFYFDASAVIVTAILTGSYLEHLTREKARGALRELQALLPSTALVIRAGRETEVPVAEIQVGDRFVVKPGGRIPADGTVREGRSSTDEALVTGESLPVDKQPGSTIIAGTINGEGRLIAEATKVGEDTVLSQIGTLLAEAETSKVPMQQLADRIASIFTPVVLGIALAAGAGWFLFGGAPFNISLLIFVTVAITACPCAFGLATPAAIISGTGRAAKDGVLFKGRDSIEKAAVVDIVMTDKTGTLTEGKPKLTDLVPLGRTTERELLSLAVALESASEHPLARAVVRRAKEEGVSPPKVMDFLSQPGVGLQGTIDGRKVSIVTGQSLSPPTLGLPDLATKIEGMTQEGKACSVLLVDGQPAGLLGFFDAPASGVREAVASLKQDGVEVIMLTGDNERAARQVASRVGIREVRASLKPAQKMEILKAQQAVGKHVAYVGDGINDAPSLMAADVGIAIGAGADVAREAGGVILMRSDFSSVALSLRIARRTVRKVRLNLFWALGYNSLLLPVAAGLLVPFLTFTAYDYLPLVGAAAMGLSSTSVLLNSFSLRWVHVGDSQAARLASPSLSVAKPNASA